MRRALWLLLVPSALWAQAPAHYRAETHCAGGVPISELPLRGSTAKDSIETTAHEAVHRRQMIANCDSVLGVWSESLSAKMAAEAEALCVGMRAAGLSELERKQRAVQAALWWAQYRGEWSFSEYLAVFSLWCNS